MRLMILVLGAVCALFGQQGAPVTAGDLLKMKQVAGVTVSRDGAVAVYGVKSMYADVTKEGETKYGYRTHLWRVGLEGGGKPEQLTFGDRNDSAAVMSPDGKALAFLRVDNGGAKPKAQAWVMRLDGGGEAEMVTTLEQGVSGVEWRPDGKALLVTSGVPLSKIEGKPHFSLDRPGREPERYTKEQLEAAKPEGTLEEVRAWLYKNGQKDNPTVITRLNFLGEQGLAPEMSIAHLFVVELEGKREAKLLAGGYFPHLNAKYSPDGAWIAYSSWPDTKGHPDRERRGAVRLMKADGSGDRALLDGEKESWQFVRFTADGTLVVTLAKTEHGLYEQAQAALVTREGTVVRMLAAGWDAAPQGLEQVDEKTLVFTSPWHSGMPLMAAALSGGPAKALVEGAKGVTALAAGGGRVVYALTEVANPNELYVREANGATRRLTELNAWVAGKRIVQPEEHWLTRPDGTLVQYWVMKPAGAEAGKRYPWVLEMHGGPAAMWGPGEASMWQEFQVLCAWGYGVVYANPRGSGGYGRAFLKANYQDWGAGPSGDVLAALDEVVKTEPLVDKGRLYLTGGSYAGYLTAWIVGHDRRFKAAVAQRGVYELETFYGEGNANRLVEGAFGGYPWEAATKKVLERESPWTYVAQIETPLLIIHASEDLRTGVTQSEMMFRALEQRGKAVEYVRYPGEGHELTRSGNPGRRMDHLLRIVEFFERYR